MRLDAWLLWLVVSAIGYRVSVHPPGTRYPVPDTSLPDTSSQDPRRSQHGSVTQRVATTDIAISYNRPVARGRTLFGADGIVRWGRIWHPGADSATTISFSKAVTIQGHELAAGRYTLWAIPEEAPKPWTVIFNRTVDIWHIPYPGESSDVLRITVPSETGVPMETLAYYFPMVDADSAVLRLHWGTMIVPLRIKSNRD